MLFNLFMSIEPKKRADYICDILKTGIFLKISEEEISTKIKPTNLLQNSQEIMLNSKVIQSIIDQDIFKENRHEMVNNTTNYGYWVLKCG